MSSKRGPGQQGFEVTNQIPIEPVDFKERHGVASALDERHLGRVATEAFVETDLALIAPEIFQEVLFTAGRRSESRFINGLAINAAEAESVPGSVNHLTKRVAQRTDASRKRRGDTNAERRAEKAGKSKTETLQGYLDKREGVLSGLDYDLEQLEGLHESLQHRNLNRGYQGKLLTRLNYVIEFVFGNMFEVMADELGWDNATRESAKQAMRYQVILSPHRLSYTQALTKVGIKYTKARSNIFKSKYDWADKGLKKLDKTGQIDLLQSSK